MFNQTHIITPDLPNAIITRGIMQNNITHIVLLSAPIIDFHPSERILTLENSISLIDHPIHTIMHIQTPHVMRIFPGDFLGPKEEWTPTRLQRGMADQEKEDDIKN